MTAKARAVGTTRSPQPITVVVLLGAFWPGNEAGGPQRSLIGWCRKLGNDVSFKVIARDRPTGGQHPLLDGTGWVDHGYARFRYLPVRCGYVSRLAATLRATNYDLLIANGFFDPEFTLQALLLRRLGLLPDRPLILSPRGDLSAGALAMKSYKKRPYLVLMQRAGLLNGVWLHAASELERADIANALPGHDRVLVAANVAGSDAPCHVTPLTEPGRLRLVYLSRIDAKKNLAFALDFLRRLPFPVQFDIYGPVSDARYWHRCQRLIAAMPDNISVHYGGVVENEAAVTTLARYDALLLPTLGENFCHVIVEALNAGTPVITSDRTPWRDLRAKNAGWDLPLGEPERFVEATAWLNKASQAERIEQRTRARQLGQSIVAKGDAVAQTRRMFRKVIDDHSRARLSGHANRPARAKAVPRP